MWRFGIVIAAAAMILSSGLASATVYTFQDTETSALSSSPVSFDFSLDTATAGVSAGGATFDDVAIDENGTASEGNSVVASFTTDLSSGSLFFWVDTSTEPFYSGSGTGIAFNTGTFAIADGLTDGEGTLTISAGAVSATPEPATWMLLLSGGAVAAVGGCVSRRPQGNNAAMA